GSVTQAHQLSQIDPWFLSHIHAIAALEKQLIQGNLNQKLLRQLKQAGFSDQAIAQLKNKSVNQVRALRLKHKIVPYVKQIDTSAGEFAAQTNYLYLSYHAVEHDIAPAA